MKNTILICVLLCTLFQLITNPGYNQSVKPKNTDALYAGESVSLENNHIKIIFFKRKAGVYESQKDGYSWAEIYGPDKTGRLNKYLGVLEHFGEVDIQGHIHPLRMDAIDHKLEKLPEGEKITFQLLLQIPEDACMVWDNHVAVKGKAEFFLPKNSHSVNYELYLQPDFMMYYRFIRGPWLKIGAFDDQLQKQDAIFPGMEWLKHDEWSSSIDFLAPSTALRVAPHPRKVTAPVMSVCVDSLTVSVSWNPYLGSTDALSRIRNPQPVFASPNFIDKRNEHLMGLIFPTSGSGMKENHLSADGNLVFPGQGVRFQSSITVTKGNSLDALVHWVKKEGLPSPGIPRFDKEELTEKIAQAYNEHFWEESKGWSYHKVKEDLMFHGTSWYLSLGVNKVIRDKPLCYVPEFVDYYLKNGKNRALKKDLKEKTEKNREKCHYKKRSANGTRINGFPEMFDWYTDKQLRAFGAEILNWQSETGSFYYDHFGRHTTEHEKMARSYRPLGQPGDSVLDFYMTSSILLLTLGEALDEEQFTKAGKKALDVAMPLDRPEGGDWWETPLHTPNYYTAGWGAIAYYLGYKIFGEEKYEKRSIHFLRAQLPFTYLWTTDLFPMMYHTKPLYGGTGWRYMDWTDRCVHWQVISIINISRQLGFDWKEINPEIDWDTFQKGALYAGMRLLADHTDKEWRVHSEDVNEAFNAGKMDMFVSDTFDPVNFMYGGLGVKIPPNALMMSLIHVWDEK